MAKLTDIYKMETAQPVAAMPQKKAAVPAAPLIVGKYNLATAQPVQPQAPSPSAGQFESMAPELFSNKPLPATTPQGYPVEQTIAPFNQNAGQAPDLPVRRLAQDVTAGAAKSVVATGGALMGLADLTTAPAHVLTGGRVALPSQGFRAMGWNPEATQKVLDTLYSPETQQAKKKVNDAVGFLGKVGEALKNPSVIGATTLESLGPMLLGMGQARALTSAGKMGAVGAAAFGEGLTTAGSQITDSTSLTPDGGITGKQLTANLGSATLTALISLASGGLQRKLGIDDIDVLIAGGKAQQNSAIKNPVIKTMLSAFFEGAVEELPQSTQESILSNIANDRPWNEGLEDEMAMGMLSGFAMGLGGGAGGAIQTSATDATAIQSAKAEADRLNAPTAQALSELEKPPTEAILSDLEASGEAERVTAQDLVNMGIPEAEAKAYMQNRIAQGKPTNISGIGQENLVPQEEAKPPVVSQPEIPAPAPEPPQAGTKAPPAPEAVKEPLAARPETVTPPIEKGGVSIFTNDETGEQVSGTVVKETKKSVVVQDENGKKRTLLKDQWAGEVVEPVVKESLKTAPTVAKSATVEKPPDERTDESGAKYTERKTKEGKRVIRRWTATKHGKRKGDRYDSGDAVTVIVFEEDTGATAPRGNGTDVEYVKEVIGKNDIIVGQRRATDQELARRRERFEREQSEFGADEMDATEAKELGYVREGDRYVFGGGKPVVTATAKDKKPKLKTGQQWRELAGEEANAPEQVTKARTLLDVIGTKPVLEPTGLQATEYDRDAAAGEPTRKWYSAGSYYPEGWNKQKMAKLKNALRDLDAGKPMRLDQVQLIDEASRTVDSDPKLRQQSGPDTAKDVVEAEKFSNRGDKLPVNESDMETGDLVFKDGEWYRAENTPDGTTLVDGKEVDLNHSQEVGVGALFKTTDGETYKVALQQYREQEAMKSAKPASASAIDEAMKSEYGSGVDITDEWRGMTPKQRQDAVASGLHIETDRSGNRVIGSRSQQSRVDELRQTVMKKAADRAESKTKAVSPSGQAEFIGQDEGGFKLTGEVVKQKQAKPKDQTQEMFTTSETRGRALDDLDAKGPTELKRVAEREGVDLEFVKPDAASIRTAIRSQRNAAKPAPQDIEGEGKKEKAGGYVTIPDRKGVNRIMRQFKRWFSREFASDRGLGEETRAAVLERGQAMEAAMIEARSMSKIFKAARDSLAKRFGKADVIQWMQDVIYGNKTLTDFEAHFGVAPGNAAVDILDKFHQKRLDNSKEIARLLKARGASPELIDGVLNNEFYVSRFYQKFIMGEEFVPSEADYDAAVIEIRAGIDDALTDLIDTANKMRGGTARTAIDIIRYMETRNPALVQGMSKSRVTELRRAADKYDKLRQVIDTITYNASGEVEVTQNTDAVLDAARSTVDYYLNRKQQGTGEIDISHMKRRYLEGAFRALYKEITDPVFAPAMTIETQDQLIANMVMIETIATQGDGKVWTGMASEKTGTTKQLGNKDSMVDRMRYGRLAGKFVTPELYDVMTGGTKVNAIVKNAWYTPMGIMRGMKLIGPKTITRNYVEGYIGFAVGCGDAMRSGYGKNFKRASKLSMGLIKGDAAALEEVSYLLKKGVVSMRGNAQAEDVVALLSKDPRTWAGNKFKKLMEDYGIIDFPTKISAYWTCLDRGMTEEQAIAHVKKFYQNPQALPKVVGQVSKAGIADYSPYFVDSIRIRANQVKEAISAGKKGDLVPAIGLTLSVAIDTIRRSAMFAAKSSAILAAWAAIQSKFRDDDDELEDLKKTDKAQELALREFMPEWYQDAPLLVWKENYKNGSSSVYYSALGGNSSFPLEDLIYGGIQAENKLVDVPANVLKTIFRERTRPGMYPSALYKLFTGDSLRGDYKTTGIQDVMFGTHPKKNAIIMESMLNFGMDLYGGQFGPKLQQNIALRRKGAGDTEPVAGTYTPYRSEQEIWISLFNPTRTYGIDKNEAGILARNKFMNLRDAMMAAKGLVSMREKNLRGRGTSSEYLDKMSDLGQSSRMKYLKQAKQIADNAVVAFDGILTDKEVMAAMMDGIGISEKEAKAVMRGDFDAIREYRPTTKKTAMQKANEPVSRPRTTSASTPLRL